ncbi:MAG: hypothetical protein OIN89_06025 [Candidatus Methanoperedens sp.]|jgi:hypothetical protein|nr:hypothetical protein [Candidatus Methanoperedens sp.]PKL53814.1 MAG: hypothetical protein CVV36_05115 [Candidatus Methanoperedenaceae archaeon HGW-Methanoperedenaceae-1]
MLSINEIGEEYKKRRIFLYLYISIGLLLIIIMIAFIAFNEPQYLLVGFFLMIFLSLLILFFPRLTTFELIRYHLAKLGDSLNERSSKKSEDHLNRLVYDLKLFDDRLDNNFILHSAKATLKKFRDLLKFNVYPCIKENDYGSYVESLRDINFAFNNGNINHFNTIIADFSTDIHNEDILLPYEKPPIWTRSINTVSITFNSSLIFRFICFTFVCLMIAITFFPLDNTTFFGAGGISAVLAAAYKSKI